MKCKCLVKPGKKKPLPKFSYVLYRQWQESKDWQPDPGTEQCDGDIVVEVRAVEEPEWGGTNAALEIEYRCSKCGNLFFGELPQTSEELSRFLTSIIAAMTDEQRETFIQRRLNIEKSTNERTDVFLKDGTLANKKNKLKVDALSADIGKAMIGLFEFGENHDK